MKNFKVKCLVVVLSCVLLGSHVLAQDLLNSGSSLQIQFEECDDEKKIEMLMGNALSLRSSNLRESTFCYKYALDLAEKTNALEQMMNASFELATNFKKADSYRYALKYYRRSEELAIILNDTLSLGRSSHFQGKIYYLLRNYDKAESFFLRAIEYYDALHAFIDIGNCYNNLGLLYDKSDLDRSLAYYKKAYRLELQHGFDRNRGLYLNNMACIHLYKGELDQAKVLLDSSYMIVKRDHDHRSLAFVYSSYGEFYQSNHQYSLAEDMYLKSIQLLKEYSHIGDIQDISLLLSGLYEEMNDHRSALSYYKGYIKNQDSIARINDNKQFQKHEFEKEIRQLEYQKDLEILDQRKKQQFYRVLFIFCFLFLMLIMVLLVIKKRIEVKRIILSKENHELKESLLVEKIESRNKELTSKAIQLGERNALIKNVSEKLNWCKPKLKKSNLEVIQVIIDDLNSNVNEKQWEDFQKNFNYLYPVFFNNILSDFPNLSPGELKLCSFLKLNMTSKEIAQFTHMTTNSVEVSRSRLRKKLGLSKLNISFFVFLSKY